MYAQHLTSGARIGICRVQRNGGHIKPKSDERPQFDEEGIGVEGEGSLVCRTQVSGKTRRFQRQIQADLSPGSTVRVSVGVSGTRVRGDAKVARILAFVDPLTGKLIIRMGMYNIKKNTVGHEEDQQLVYESDVPVVKLDGSD